MLTKCVLRSCGIILAFVCTTFLSFSVSASEPTQQQKDVVRNVLTHQEASCSPGSKCFVEKEKACLKLKTADEKIDCLDKLQGR